MNYLRNIHKSNKIGTILISQMWKLTSEESSVWPRVVQLEPTTAVGLQDLLLICRAQCKMEMQNPSFKRRKKFLLLIYGVSWHGICFVFDIWYFLNHRNTSGLVHTLIGAWDPCPRTQGRVNVLEQGGSNWWAKTGKWDARKPTGRMWEAESHMT